MPYKDKDLRRQKTKERYARIKSDPEMSARYKEQTRLWKEANRDRVNAGIKARKEEKKEYLVEMLGGSCVGCGTTESLQFDHIDRKTKSFTIGKKMGYSLEYLIPEAKKCQLLCKECHKIKTTINHDMNELADGYYVKNVDRIGDEIIVTLGKLAQGG